MIKPLIVLAALMATPATLFAQEVPAQPAPEVSTESPAFAAPSPLTLDSDDRDVPLVPSPQNPANQSVAPSQDETGDAEPLGPVDPSSLTAPDSQSEELWQIAQQTSARAIGFLETGGPSIWAIAALSVITLTLILWKTWRLALIGAWSRGMAGQAVNLFEAGDAESALATVMGRRGIRSRVVAHAIRSIRHLPEKLAREETARVAKRELAQAGTGLRALELIATIAPLLGLLGTVLGMIAAFQALQQAGNRADPALLAGGIWEALLTTAAGMAVAIPASAALTWFEAVIDRIRQDVEDGATRLFVADRPNDLKLAAE